MQLNIKATNLELTDAIRDCAQKKVDMLEKFMQISGAPQNPIAYVVVEKLTGDHHKKGKVFRCELQFDLGSQLLRVEKISVDMYKSIEKVKDEMERQLIRYKKKIMDKERKG